MPESIPDYSAHIATLERKLRALKRNIIGTADAGRTALENSESAPLFEARFEYVQQDWEDFKKIWNELDEVSSAAGVQFPSRTWQEFFDTSRDEIYQSRSLLLQIERLRARAEHPPTPPNENRQSLNMTLSSTSKSHLPRISLPQFSGDVFKWTHFRDTFSSMVHNEATLTKVEKFHYLLRSLDGEAASLLARFPVEENSYDQAWGKLCENYNNPRVLASLFLQQIIECDFKGMRSELERYSHFLTSVADSIEGFRSLKLEDPCEFLLASLALRALDPQTRRNFELSQNSSTTFPSANDVIKFVRQRKMAITMARDFGSANSSSPGLNSAERSSQPRFPVRRSSKYNPVVLHSSSNRGRSSQDRPNSAERNKTAKNDSLLRNQQTQCIRTPEPKVCPFCQGEHALPGCYRFSNSPPHERIAFVQNLKCCSNCLRVNHSLPDCRSKWTCRFCKGKHHSLVHQDSVTATQGSSLNQQSSSHNSFYSAIGSGSCELSSPCSLSLLGTAKVYIIGKNGEQFPARAVLDSGSQHTFITFCLAKKIQANLREFEGTITGIGGSNVSKPAGFTPCQLRSCYNNHRFSTQAVVVDTIAPCLPRAPINSDVVQKLSQYRLADEDFHTPGNIDMLIGIDLFSSLITGAPYHSGVGQLHLLPSVLGLIIIGKFDVGAISQSISFFAESQSTIEQQLKAFWELEEPKSFEHQDPLDKICEEHFVSTHERTAKGRYMLRLPLLPDAEPLGTNREVVTKRFINLERRFNNDTQLREHYTDFMHKYEKLGHMSPASTESPYLIPHHGVWQDRPSGRKLRVVFDASCPSSSTQSLNSILFAGPKLQADLSEVLINFRLFRIPLCADLVKMYRQILIHPDDRKLQHILWRHDPSDELKEFELNTVTYGTKSSAYQALRSVKQLVADDGSNYPLAVRIITQSMYVDDIVGGANTLEEAKELQHQLCTLFSKGGFTLSKWASTESELIPEQEKVQPVQLKPHDNDSVKILGLVWNPMNDSFSYASLQPPLTGVTKRIILSSIARIFDPLGLLSPVIFLVKVLLQEIWKMQLGWDQLLPTEINNTWLAIANEWNILPLITIKRYISSLHAHLQLIGFCDASEKGYAASLYLRTEEENGRVHVSLIKAKTKVAPIKYTSIARLELCGAVLLARLLSTVKLPMLKEADPICFTDSTVVLHWLRTPTYKLKAFEANRIAEVLVNTPQGSWRHVKSEDNPSDIASRGCILISFVEMNFGGMDPHGLSILWKNETTSADDWMSDFSSFSKLIKTVSYALRFLARIRPPRTRITGPITSEEFRAAKFHCVRLTQKTLPLKELKQLTPFIDEMGIIRVGGRLQNAPIQSASKHPMLLSRKSHLALLIIRDIHERHFHSGPNLTLALLRCEFWIPGALRFIRSTISRCVHCRIQRAKPIYPLMAPLPKARFSQVRPFLQVGLDYAGPFLIKDSNRRKPAITKAYLCLFTCMATKALHLEAVSSLKTTDFLASLDRFISRRGLPLTIWSDHGTNYIGASRYLKDLYQFLAEHEDDITHWLAPKQIEWRFIPPRAPHFGGLWEAGVKSVKSLLAGSVGSQPFTFEELATIFIRIEGVLNSRPLCSLNEDPENCDYLTPGHFIIGAPISSIPEPYQEPSFKSPTTRWEAVQAQVQFIWNRWRLEYMHSLQQKGKWTQHTPNLRVGELVIMIEQRTTAGQWPVARICAVHPGKDGVVRTVTVRTPSGKNFVRPVVALAPLFYMDQDPHSSLTTSIDH